jgi:hypothetical protein
VPTSETPIEQVLSSANKLPRKPPFAQFSTRTARLLTNKELRDKFLPGTANHSDEDPEYEDDGDDEEDAGVSDEEVADTFAATTDSDDPDFEGIERFPPPRKRMRVRDS